MTLTQKEIAIVTELIDLNDMFFGPFSCKNPIEQVINDNSDCFNNQKVTQKDFNTLFTKIHKSRVK